MGRSPLSITFDCPRLIALVLDCHRKCKGGHRSRGRYKIAHLILLQIRDLAMAMFNWVAVGALALFGVWTLKTYLKYRRSMNAVGWLPGPKTFFSARALFARLLPNTPYVNRKPDQVWELKYNRKLDDSRAE